MAKAKAERPETVSKMKMVELALQQHGDIGPKEMQSRIKEAHNVEIPTTMISSYKSNILRKQGAGPASGGRAAVGDVQIGVRDLTVLQGLIDRIGASELHSLIRVLSRK